MIVFYSSFNLFEDHFLYLNRLCYKVLYYMCKKYLSFIYQIEIIFIYYKNSLFYKVRFFNLFGK